MKILIFLIISISIKNSFSCSKYFIKFLFFLLKFHIFESAGSSSQISGAASNVILSPPVDTRYVRCVNVDDEDVECGSTACTSPYSQMPRTLFEEAIDCKAYSGYTMCYSTVYQTFQCVPDTQGCGLAQTQVGWFSLMRVTLTSFLFFVNYLILVSK